MQPMKRGRALVLILALMVGAAGAEDGNAGKIHRIAIKGFEFIPRQLVVHSGDTIVWANEDIVPHTATAKGGFDSKEIGPMKSWRYKVTRKGKFGYICSYHPTMTGEFTVE